MQLGLDQIEFLKQHWSIEGEVRFHRRLANFVYFTNLNGEEVVLRLTQPYHRKFEELKSELHWLTYLNQNGMQVANPIATKTGEFIVELEGESLFYASIFVKAKGAPLTDEEACQPEVIKTWGRYLGQMQSLTKKYNPPSRIQRRQNWREDESLAMALRSMDPKDGIPYTRLNELLEWMTSLPQDNESYGLIHTDLHRGNFFFHEGALTGFDFDDACYQWFSYDLIAPLNSVHKNFYEGNEHTEKAKTTDLFLQGYSTQNTLSPLWIDRIELFDKYRAAMVFHWTKTFLREGMLTGPKAIGWAARKAPEMVEVLRAPLKLR